MEDKEMLNSREYESAEGPIEDTTVKYTEESAEKPLESIIENVNEELAGSALETAGVEAEEMSLRESEAEQVQETLKESEAEPVQESETVIAPVSVRKTKRHGTLKRMKALSSIKFKLIFSFAIPVLLIIVLGIVSYSASAKALQNSFKRSSQSTINMTSDYYNLMFSNIKATSNEIMGNTTIQGYYSGAYAHEMLTESENYSTINSTINATAVGNKAISNIFVIGPYGKNIYTTSSKLNNEPDALKNLKESSEAKAIDAKNSAWFTSREYMDEMVPVKYGVSLGRPLLGTSKRGIGYIFFDLSYDYVTEPIRELDLGANSITGLVAPDGGELVFSNYMDIDPETSYFVDKDFYQEIVDSKEPDGSMDIKYNGKKQVLMYSKTDDGFIIFAIIPESEIVSQASKIKVISIVTIVIAFMIAFIVGGYLSRNISGVIKRLMKKLEQAATGDLSVDMRINRNDEFKVLADSAESMVGNFKNLIVQTKNVSETVEDSSVTVSESAKKLLSDTKEITVAIGEIENGVVQQAEDSEDCLRQMDELSDKINIVSDNSTMIARIADDTNEIVATGMESIEELKVNVKSTVDITSRVIEEIENLREETNSIEHIISVINEIAEQTNLLSLNASIEAARAGEAGRGFSVVADEIRKLAEQSVNSANEIRRIIDGINGKTNETVQIAKQAEDVVDVQEKSLENASAVFADIQRQFGNLMGNLENITSQIDAIAESKARTIDAISSISAVSQQTAAASEEVTETANRQLQSVEKLNIAAEELIRHSGQLTEAIDVFKIE
ncbi:MAG: methyl-accepting chemotaxis protein [Lachnospira sp.]